VLVRPATICSMSWREREKDEEEEEKKKVSFSPFLSSVARALSLAQSILSQKKFHLSFASLLLIAY